MTHREAPDMEAFLRRTLRAMTRRAAEGDHEALVALVAIRAEADTQIHEAARALHRFGYSWAYLADALGVTRQAAQQRFGRCS